MPFVTNLVCCQPFLRKASQHPNKALFNFDLQETTMSSSYDSILLDHLAEHMLYLSTASSFWFSLNLSYDNGCHLSQQSGMLPTDYEYHLVAANLAQFHPKWGFNIKILKWKQFLEGHWFTASKVTGMFEVDTKK
jgi:hypothetical protein